MGDPQTTGNPTIGDLQPVVTTNMAVGTFLIGSGNPEATVIRDRTEALIEVSNSHSDFFTTNRYAVRCERRTCLVTRRAGSFIYGTLAGSPA
jgi:hypothetical protein